MTIQTFLMFVQGGHVTDYLFVIYCIFHMKTYILSDHLSCQVRILIHGLWVGNRLHSYMQYEFRLHRWSQRYRNYYPFAFKDNTILYTKLISKAVVLAMHIYHTANSLSSCLSEVGKYNLDNVSDVDHFPLSMSLSDDNAGLGAAILVDILWQGFVCRWFQGL